MEGAFKIQFLIQQHFIHKQTVNGHSLFLMKETAHTSGCEAVLAHGACNKVQAADRGDFYYRCRLLLNSLHEDDSGTYTCKLSTAKGK